MSISPVNFAVAIGIAAGFSFLTGLALSMGIKFDDLAVPLCMGALASTTPLFFGFSKKCEKDKVLKERMD